MNEHAHILPTILRLPEVLHTVGLSRPSLYRLMKAESFPLQVQLSPGAVGWLSTEIEAWVADRAAARSTSLAA